MLSSRDYVACMSIRRATEADAALLLEMLSMAADWRADSGVRPVEGVLAEPSLAHYAAEWPKDGDDGWVAEDANGRPVGAAWWRFFGSGDPGFGFVAQDVPEVSIAVRPQHRGRGVGSALMHRLISDAHEQALNGLSLSVERENAALRLYARLGFVEVGGSDDAATMLLRFSAA